MTVRQHLQEFHKTESRHQSKMAAHHGRLAKCFGSMGKAAPATDSDMYKAIAAEHEQTAKDHEARAAYHDQCADDCEKAHQDSLSKIRPDAISSIARIDTPTAAFGFTAVPRRGQPEIVSKATVDAIDPRFRHLLNFESEV